MTAQSSQDPSIRPPGRPAGPLGDNPYQPPQSDVQEEEDAPGWVAPEEIASTGARVGNLILDNICYLVFSMVIGMTLGVISALFNLPGILEALENTLVSYAFGFGLAMLYYVPQEALFGRTLGKLLTGTKVVMEDGTRPTFGAAMLRTLCRFIPFEAFTFLGGDRPVGWHDSLSKTRVISTR